ncbi:MAG: hydroxymethylglutaryl-CoA lyase [Bacillota bacterium]
MNLPQKVIVREVGPRDGLQREPVFVPTAVKVELVNRLVEAKLPVVEATSFVSPRAVPQMADAEQVMKQIIRKPGVTYCALTANANGCQRAFAAGADEIHIVVSASEIHNLKNINRTTAQALEEVSKIMECAGGRPVRGAVVMAFGCPWEGEIAPELVARLAGEYISMGISHITLADTSGMGNPLQVRRVIDLVLSLYPQAEITLHLHDTRGLGMANTLAALEAGINIFEVSVGGLGGCTVVPGAIGNVATEDLVFMLHSMGVVTGVDLEKLVECARWLQDALDKPLPGKVMRAEYLPESGTAGC